MKIERAKAAFPTLLMVFCATAALAQGVRAPQAQTQTKAIRVIRDPHTALQWLLESDPARPGGPGRIVLLGNQKSSQPESSNIVNGIVNEIAKSGQNVSSAVIRCGDRLVVEENSAVVEARLEAVALNSAIQGAELRVRLAIGGKILRVIAIGPGRAVFETNAGRP